MNEAVSPYIQTPNFFILYCLLFPFISYTHIHTYSPAPIQLRTISDNISLLCNHREVSLIFRRNVCHKIFHIYSLHQFSARHCSLSSSFIFICLFGFIFGVLRRFHIHSHTFRFDTSSQLKITIRHIHNFFRSFYFSFRLYRRKKCSFFGMYMKYNIVKLLQGEKSSK